MNIKFRKSLAPLYGGYLKFISTDFSFTVNAGQRNIINSSAAINPAILPSSHMQEENEGALNTTSYSGFIARGCSSRSLINTYKLTSCDNSNQQQTQVFHTHNMIYHFLHRLRDSDNAIKATRVYVCPTISPQIRYKLSEKAIFDHSGLSKVTAFGNEACLE